MTCPGSYSKVSAETRIRHILWRPSPKTLPVTNMTVSWLVGGASPCGVFLKLASQSQSETWNLANERVPTEEDRPIPTGS